MSDDGSGVSLREDNPLLFVLEVSEKFSPSELAAIQAKADTLLNLPELIDSLPLCGLCRRGNIISYAVQNRSGDEAMGSVSRCTNVWCSGQ